MPPSWEGFVPHEGGNERVPFKSQVVSWEEEVPSPTFRECPEVLVLVIAIDTAQHHGTEKEGEAATVGLVTVPQEGRYCSCPAVSHQLWWPRWNARCVHWPQPGEGQEGRILLRDVGKWTNIKLGAWRRRGNTAMAARILFGHRLKVNRRALYKTVCPRMFSISFMHEFTGAHANSGKCFKIFPKRFLFFPSLPYHHTLAPL